MASLSRILALRAGGNDIEVYRELWGDAALYFERNNAESLRRSARPAGCRSRTPRFYGTRAYNRARERFTARRMVDDYLRLYRRLATPKAAGGVKAANGLSRRDGSLPRLEDAASSVSTTSLGSPCYTFLRHLFLPDR